MPEWASEGVKLFVTALLGGAFGGGFAYLFRVIESKNQRKREDEREKDQRAQELRGYLHLIHAEIRSNDFTLTEHSRNKEEDYINNTKLVNDPGRPLNMDAWEQTRIRIVQLLSGDKFARLDEYYSNVQVMNNLLDQRTSPQAREDNVQEVVGKLADQSTELMAWIQQDYIQPTPRS